MRSAHRKKRVPSPPGLPVLGHLLAFRKDVLSLLSEGTATYGNIVKYRLGPHVVHFVNHPSYIEHVLLGNHQNYDKATRSSSRIKWICGESLLVTNGEQWAKQRKLLQPSFHRRNIQGFATTITDATGIMLNQWSSRVAKGSTHIDMASEMMHLTFSAVAKSLFSADVDLSADILERSIATVLHRAYHSLEKAVDIPPPFPTPGNMRFNRALHALDQAVYTIIREHRAHPPDQSDLLSMLMEATDQTTGKGLSDQELRDQTITLLLAGHETTANALTWTWHLITRHSRVEQLLREEVHAVLGDRIPQQEDLPNLKYTSQVFKESMRLYPPIWIMERSVVEDDEIDGYHIQKNSSLVISPYTMHRNPAYWDEPNEFNPERFNPEVKRSSPYTYIPYGGGKRVCIGSHFANMEAVLIIPMILQAYHIKSASATEVRPDPGIALRPRNGLPMELIKI